MNSRRATCRPVHLPTLRPLLRAAVGLRSIDLALGEHAPCAEAPLPETLCDLDTGAWLSWSHAGLRLFASPQLPTLRQTTAQARRVLLAIAIERSGGNISCVARWLGSSRRVIRESLRAAGLYGRAGP